MKIGTARLGDGTVVVVESSEGKAVMVPQYTSVDAVLNSDSKQFHHDVNRALETEPPRALNELEWMPPVTRPGKVLCVALNNSANPERIMSGPSTPAMFVKPSSSLIGHEQPIRIRESYGRVHPEPELAVIIGRGGNDIPVDQALDHVFGYTIFNDITSPTMRTEDTFHYRAIHPSDSEPDGIRYVESWVTYPARYKGADTFGPLGPWVVTSDDIPDPHALRIRCFHNDRVITDDTTENLRFSVAEVISFASSYLSLEAGDVIAMGTALKRATKGSAVQNVDLGTLGGTVTVEIEKLGALRNPVARR
ncbi:fumarylacetoacetate hydrolase family protein [Rhodococcus erythropolis]|uniref:fumarylacetoacetate hydrolase family protein n=1 Tax=Rhodococcus erythropolis TaxID=1833 RepID=UPI00406BC1B4